MNFYINELFQKFVDANITPDMNDLEKAEKAAWYIGAYTDSKYYSESWITLCKFMHAAKRWVMRVTIIG